jgi:hypothetical protein
MLKRFISISMYFMAGPRFYVGAGVAAAGVGAAVGGGISAATSGKGGKKSGNALYDNPAFQATIQSKLNADALQQSRTNQIGPQGSTTWNGNTQTTTLSPEQQRLYDSTTKSQQQASDYLNANAGKYAAELDKGFESGALYTDFAKKQADYGADVLRGEVSGGDMAQRQRIEDSLMARLNPSLERDQNALAQSLANQGLAPGSEAYINAMQDQSRRVNDARLGVIGQGTQEMAATQNMDLAKRNQVMGEQQDLLGLAQVQQQIGNNTRDQAMNERTGLMQQAGNAAIPAYSGSYGQINSVNMAPIFEANRQNNIANQNLKTAQSNQLNSSLGNLGGGITDALTNSSTFKNWFK